MQILKILPKNLLSRAIGELAQLEQPELVAQSARDWFIRRYNINLDEAEKPLSEYPSIAKLFIRRLKPGVRPIGTGLVHPCDAKLTCAEIIERDQLLQAKGRFYSLNKLLADDQALSVYEGGVHLVYYLCPTDYHRVHAPVDAEITKITHVPGALWPVNEWSVHNIPELFAVNERLIFHLQTTFGPAALVMVGATNVGQMSVSFDPDIVTNQRGLSEQAPLVKTYAKPFVIKKGDELGVFHMGSTVVMIYPPGVVNVLPKTGPTRMGQSV